MSGQRRIALIGALAALGALGAGPGVAVPSGQLTIAPAPAPVAPPTLSGAGNVGHSRRAEVIGRSFGAHRNSYKNWPPRTVAQDKRDARKRRNRGRHRARLKAKGR